MELMGDVGLSHGITPNHLKEIRRLKKENDQLKKLIVEKDLEAHLKDELLKKKYPWPKKKT